VYGKSKKRTAIIDGRARKSYGHGKPIGTSEVMIKDHHEGYISWADYDRNQKQLAQQLWPRRRREVRPRRQGAVVGPHDMWAMRVASGCRLYRQSAKPSGVSLR
jgi:hypothetical protein